MSSAAVILSAVAVFFCFVFFFFFFSKKISLDILCELPPMIHIKYYQDILFSLKKKKYIMLTA